jgi:chromosome partitioning protein
MKIIAVVAQKGGTGKTTLAAHLAVEAEMTGPRPIVLIDLDPQASLRGWYEKRTNETPLLVDTPITILGIRRMAAGIRSMAATLEDLRARGAGLVLIDTAPHITTSATAASMVADLVVIPTRAGSLDIEAIGATVDIAHQVEGEAVIVLNAVRPRGSLTQEARQALEVYGLPICPTAIVNRAALADALIDGRGVQELDPKGKGAGEIREVWKWLKRRL